MRKIPEPVIRRFPGKNEKWEVMADFRYHLHSGAVLVVRKGFVFDGGSIPRIFWAVAHPLEFPTSFCAHDAWYAAELGTRRDGDYLLSETIPLEGGSEFQRRVIFDAVRLCGWAVWRKHTAYSIEQARRYCQIK